MSVSAERFRRARGWLGVCAATLSLSSACSSQKPGELILVVTTDMALPDDFNELMWSVTQTNQQSSSGSFDLARPDSLPGTLAILAGEVEGETIVVRVEGRTGGPNGPLRVYREARLKMPRAGETKMLPMPLNWLCSLEPRAATCDLDSTCSDGSCATGASSALPVDFVPLEDTPCFDLTECALNTALFRPETPTINAKGDCVITGPIPVAPQSVALMVNPDLVGNAGVCVPNSSGAPSAKSFAGHCFVPLKEEDTPEGWQRTPGNTELRLPPAVCEATVLHQVLKVVRTTIQNGCPRETSAQSLCPIASTCVVSPQSCPDGLGENWLGYSCSGTTTPATLGSELLYCGVSDNDPLGPALVPGHFCCTTGQSPSDVPLLIDDMSGGPLIKRRAPDGEFPASWFTASEDDVPISPPRQDKTFFTYRTIDRVTPDGEPSFDHAACLKLPNGFPGSYALEGFSFFTDGATVVPVDVSQYAGISFWARAERLSDAPLPPIGVFFPNADTDTEHASTCLMAAQKKSNCNHYRKLLELSDRWQKFSVRWQELEQATDFGMRFPQFDPQVYSVDFQALGPDAAAFDFCVSQIYFIPRPQPPQGP